ncbi:MAG: exodeoxyribonuclease V subunit alpha [Spirochaetaceae bacterium]|nr:exodeoxyribonuclease V subunit alpha [Spirochaetaceae bacterium]
MSIDFFRIGEQLGIPWFRLYLADSLVEKFDTSEKNTPQGELLRWFILHLAVQAGRGHLRSSLDSIEEEMGEWYSAAGFRSGNLPKDFDDSIPLRVAEAAGVLIEAGLESGLIGKLADRDSPGESLELPRPPLALTHDGEFIYFLRRRKEEDRFLAALELRSTQGSPSQLHFTDSGAGGIPDTPEGELLQGLIAGRRLLLLAGGPGTGKTTTIANLLKLLKPQPGSLEVILAAPTGRAAARMSENLKLQGSTAGRTIHSLLGLYPGRPPRHDADRPLAAHLVIVDEASMVDLSLMNALLAALPESAVLILVGDPDQLPSVEAGAVLGDLLYGEADAVDKASPRGKSPLGGAVVKLTKVYRSDTAILEAAAAVRVGDIKNLNGILAAPSGMVRLHAPGSPDTMARIIAREFREATESAKEPFSGVDKISGVFSSYSAQAVLSPLRQGPWGVPAMNERVSWLLGSTASPFPGMPVMITRNDPSRNLWNGDRGVIVTLEGQLRAAFPEAEEVRSFPLAALPGWEPAWVQTIHKSQGSEFDAVTILLPEGAERLLSREILYTAFTRARHAVNLYAELETVEAALERRVVRHSRIREWASGG